MHTFFEISAFVMAIRCEMVRYKLKLTFLNINKTLIPSLHLFTAIDWNTIWPNTNWTFFRLILRFLVLVIVDSSIG